MRRRLFFCGPHTFSMLHPNSALTTVIVHRGAGNPAYPRDSHLRVIGGSPCGTTVWRHIGSLGDEPTPDRTILAAMQTAMTTCNGQYFINDHTQDYE